MNNNGLILNTLNKCFSFFQDKLSYLFQNSVFLKNIDELIFTTITGIFVLSLFTSSDIIGYLALISLFLSVIKLFIKKNEKLEMNLFEKFIFAYFMVVVISLAGSSLFHLSLKGFFKTFTYMGFYFSAVQYYKSNLSKIPLTFGIIGLCAASQGVVGFFQNFAQVGEISTWQDISSINPEDVLTRVYGTLQPYNPNLFGGYLVATLPSLLGIAAYLFLNKKHKRAYSLLFFGLLTSIALFMSGCRGAYLGFASIIICFGGFLAKMIWQKNDEILKKIYLLALGGIATIGTTAILFISSIRTRIFSIFAMRADSSTSFRFNVYQSAIQMAKDNWLLGIGVGNQNFREIYGLYMRTGFDALSAYCVFLEIIVESGIFALIAFVAFLITLINKSVKFICQCGNLNGALLMMIATTTVIAVMVHGLVDTIFYRPQVQFIFWTMVAVISAILKADEKITAN